MYKILKSINDFDMLKDTKNVTIGVSGGVDSVSLLHFFVNNIDIKIKVAHVNHNLRGEESLRDENFVREICKLWNVEFVLGSFNIIEISKKSKKGIEECAREVRYKFFNEVSDNAKIVTAHSLSDNLETIIFNFTRGSGLTGLTGIPPVRENIIRPLIYTSREEIELYAKNNNLKYVTDSSNLSDLYSRNKIRHNVIPILKEINKSFENNVSKCISYLREENEFLDYLANKEINKTAEEINNLPKAIKNRVLKLILKKNKNNITSKHINLMNMLLNKKINSFNISKNKRIKIINGFISYENIFDLKERKIKKFSILKIKKDELIKHSDDCFALNGKISDFEFRTRKKGDIFRLPKRKCSKSLKKLFNELKIPIDKRAFLGILEDKSCGDIVWIESIGVSEKYQISENTNFIGKIKILNSL